MSNSNNESQPKVALVTGSSSGIGEATVKLLAEKGFKVAIHGSNKSKVDKVVQDCSELSPQKFQPLGIVLDFSEPTNGKLAVQQTIKHFGRLDVLVNNAGIYIKDMQSNPDTSYQYYKQLMAINTDATVSATLEALAELKQAKGDLVFVSSVASKKPGELGYSYCMSKAAMSMFAKCLAIDMAPDVRVNVVSPGPVHTPILSRFGEIKMPPEVIQMMMKTSTLQQRIGQPIEIANAIYFLISGQGSFVNGHELFVDGGCSIMPSNSNAASQFIKAQQQGLVGKIQ